ncbi:hypothetical protein A4H97_26665 [Niastella yeongjuensis]|uniref:DUF4369 domain-containing protein n=1 Tax=Niastella yeongjuensis TaxID=354355 RepID=A0A1V9F072_9BACT|nr:hypothetical protein [Niastella yeongjuensis]OQP51793.1 hypothetical protein A4H97_26665 [Niastella yeongjuensis]SEP44717.1 hypothetical protein SAMN05660816_06242 [Niastella yeongjuensis]
MKLTSFPLKAVCICITVCSFLAGHAQTNIEFHGIKINAVDKQKRKQGNWLFFDYDGMPVMSCVYKNDNCISPAIFYEKGDTAFVRFPQTDSIETFIVYAGKDRMYGNFIHSSDSSTRVEVEQNPAMNDSVLAKINRYKDIVMEPVFYFAQKKMVDFISAGILSSHMNLNKPVTALLTISSSGLLTKVEFPQDKNNLSPDEETEYNWIYSRMMRWQPCYRANKTHERKVLLKNSRKLEWMN